MQRTRLHSQLTLPSVRCQARLGWGEAERSRAQGVSVRLVLRFTVPPAALVTDRLGDAVDVAALSAEVAAVCSREPFRLLERLAQAIYDALRAMLPADAALWVEVGKEHPPLAELGESARFGVGDLPA